MARRYRSKRAGRQAHDGDRQNGRKPHFEAGVLTEPFLLFGGHNRHIDPKIGLTLYGPYSVADQPRPPLSTIRVGVVGPPALVSDAMHWLERCQRDIENDGSQPLLYPYFPGFSSNSIFQCELSFGKTWQETIRPDAIEKALQVVDYYQRLGAIVDLYMEAIQNLAERAPRPDVIVCVIGDDVIKVCTVERDAAGSYRRLRLTPAERLALKAKVSGQTSLLPEPSIGVGDEEVVAHHNLRRALKARAMAHGIPTQILLSRTLRDSDVTLPGERSLQDAATRAWNLTTGLYYKAGAYPWRLEDAQPDTCYCGIAFYREQLAEDRRMRTSLAQIFTHTGDGLVLRGQPFEWNVPRVSPHLTRDGAAELLQEVLALYERHVGMPPRRLVLHKSSRFWEDELAGFKEALASISSWDLVTLGKRGIQFLRQGDYPPLRGTWVRFAGDQYLIYTRGYVPILRTYPGPRAPQPVEMLEHHGATPPLDLLREMLALSKMNWNTADFSCEEPITLAFARKVGQILAEIPRHNQPQPEYRFYM